MYTAKHHLPTLGIEMVASRGLILAAGFGKRLVPLTHYYPKPLMEVLGQPIIDYTLALLARAGIEEAVVNSHHLAPVLQHYLGQDRCGVRLTHVYEPQILGTGGAIKNVQKFLQKSDPFVIVNGDILFDIDLADLIAAHETSRAQATLLLLKVLQGGDFAVDHSGHILGFMRDKNWPKSIVRGVLCGVHVWSKSALSWLFEDRDVFSNPEVYDVQLQRGEKLTTQFIDGFFGDLGTPARLWACNMALLEGTLKFNHHDVFSRFSTFAKPDVWIGQRVDIHPSAKIVKPVVIDDDAVIEANTVLGPNTVIGKRAKIGACAHIRQSVVFSGTEVEHGRSYSGSIICPKAEVVIDQVEVSQLKTDSFI